MSGGHAEAGHDAHAEAGHGHDSHESGGIWESIKKIGRFIWGKIQAVWNAFTFEDYLHPPVSKQKAAAPAHAPAAPAAHPAPAH